jgi:CHAT domain-containing protein/tetratricopeptide (TPR) repeat protein
MPHAQKQSILAFLTTVLFLFPFTITAQQPASSLTPNPALEQFAATLTAAPTVEAQEALLSTRKDLVTAELGQSLLQLGNKAMAQSEFQRAERAFALSLKVNETIGNKPGIALSLRSLGSINGIQGNFKQALDYFQRAFVAYEALGDKPGMARAVLGVGTAESASGDYEHGIASFLRSLELFEALGNKASLASVYSSLNTVYQYVGDFERALDYGLRGLRLAREIGSKPGIGMASSNLGTLYQSRGDLRAAMQSFEAALRLFEEDDDKGRIAMSLNNIGAIYLAQGNVPSAKEYFTRSLALREQIGDKDGIARATLRLGELELLQKNYPASLAYLKRSLALREESNDPSGLAAATNMTGRVFFEQGDMRQAGEYFERSLQIAEKINEREAMANVLVTLARFYLAQGETRRATEAAQRASEIATHLGLREILWEARTVAGENFLAMNDATRARASFDEAIKTIEEARLLVAGGDRERQQFFESKITPYHRMVELLVRENSLEEALAYAERAKARVLLDVLQGGRTPLNKAMTPTEQAQETKLRSNIFGLNTQLQNEAARAIPDNARLNELQAQLVKARNAFDSFTTMLYVTHPELKLQRGEARPVALQELNSLLPTPETALIQYVITENRTYLFVLTKASKSDRASGMRQLKDTAAQARHEEAKPLLHVYTLNIKRDDLTSTIERFRSQLARRDILFHQEAKKLYELLLNPAAAELSTRTRLVIVPDGALWELPFQALLNPQDKYLVEQQAISYAPSFSVLREMKRARERDEQGGERQPTFLAFGNPSLNAVRLAGPNVVQVNGKPQTITSPALIDNTFADLPEAERQVRLLANLYGSRRSLIFTGAGAGEEQFKREAGNFRVLHLATHGVLDDASPLYSYVVLARSGSNMNGNTKVADTSTVSSPAFEDGLLEAWELMRLNLRADMVVLSACETARGRVRSGEGVIGLSWALFVAGSPTTIATQWKVESASTTELMLSFYRKLLTDAARPATSGRAGTTTKAEALRQASLSLLSNDKYSHPFYWAGFVVIGDGD